jgi:hypothetical protein
MFIVNASGNVGIGTSNPTSRFVVSTGATSNDFFEVGATSNGVVSGSNNAFGRKWQIVTNDGSGTGSIRLASNVSIAFSSATSLNSGSTDTGIVRDAAGVLSVRNMTTGAVQTTLGTLLSGTVGIATTTPGFALTVAGDINLTGALRTNGSAGTSGMVLQSTGTGTQWVATSSLGISGGGGGSGTVNSGLAGQIAFYSSTGTAVSGTSSIFLLNENVGIGTTTPAQKLSVVGNGAFSGTLSTGLLNITGTGTSTINSNIVMSGDIIPSADITYTLGTVDKQWKDVYIGPGSLYINGQKVLQEESQSIVVTAELATTTIRHWAWSQPIAAGAYVTTPPSWQPRTVFVKGTSASTATARCLYVQVAATGTGPSYYGHLNYLEFTNSSLGSSY